MIWSASTKHAGASGIPMTYDDWTRLSARVRGLVASAELYASLFAQQDDALGMLGYLGAMAARVTGSINTFGAALDVSERPIKQAISSTIDRIWTFIDPATNSARGSTRPMQQNAVLAALVTLANLEAEVSYLLADRQSEIRLRAERAFAHLQRSIVVDETVRLKWQRALESGEVECEKLGAVHLLAHGIWAFKVNAAGARTDLVFQEPLNDLVGALRSSEGLVLTEWKVQGAGQSAAQCFEKARAQSKAYASGVLADAELRRVRYAIVVSDLDVETPADVFDGNLTYRNINVAVNPRVPSRRS